MKLLSTEELSREVGVPINAIWRRRKRGTLGLESVRKGRKLFFRYDREKWVKGQVQRNVQRQALISLVTDLDRVSKGFKKYINLSLEVEGRLLMDSHRGKLRKPGDHKRVDVVA